MDEQAARFSGVDADEIRQWLKTAPLDQVKDVLHAGSVILEMREEYEGKPARKQRSDRGVKRNGSASA